MKISKFFKAVVVTAGLLLAQGSQAASLVNVSVLSSTDGGATYSNSLTNLKAGQTIQYEVIAQIAPIGTTNGAKSIVTRTDHPSATTADYDGVNSLGFNLSAAPFCNFATGGLFTDSGANGADFTKITGANGGTLSATSISNVFAGLASGYYEGANVAAVVYTGAFTVDSSVASGSTGTISAAYSGGGAGFGINSNPSTGVKTLANKISISGSDTNGYLGFSSLSLSTQAEVSPVPAPSAAFGSMFVVGGLGLGGVIRRRRAV